jgi:hypothetical protein
MLGTVSFILRKKVIIRRHSEVHGRGSHEARNGFVCTSKVVFSDTIFDIFGYRVLRKLFKAKVSANIIES